MPGINTLTISTSTRMWFSGRGRRLASPWLPSRADYWNTSGWRITCRMATSPTGSKSHTAAASVIVERFTGMLTLMVVAAIAVVLNLRLFNQEWLSIALLCGIVLMASLAWLIFDKNSFHLFQKIFGSKIKIVNKIFAKIDKIRKPIFEFKNDKKAMIWAIINSLIFQLLAVINVWLSALAFGNELSFLSLLIAVPVILFIMNIPFSIGGIGLMEFAYVFTLPLFGASSSLALSTVLLIRAKSILDSIFGGILYLSINKDKKMFSELKTEKDFNI